MANISQIKLPGVTDLYDIEDTQARNNIGHILSTTLAANTTTASVTDNSISSTSILDIYTDKLDMCYDSISISDHTATITFSKSVSTVTNVKVKVLN